jgi:cellulose synthase/poly-beta-1,6-N-acetylglucosamine synthase-like glycosyltransferase
MDLSFISISAIIMANIYAINWIIFLLSYSVSKQVASSIDHNDAASIINELVSVIIPACNEESVIEDIIHDLDFQSYKNLEIIVVVHNSTDRTYEKAINVKTNHPSIILRLITKDAGKSIALNHALKYAKGSLLAFFDADNRVPSKTIENMVRVIGQGYDCVQVLLKTKNPNYNRLTTCIALEYEIYPPAYSSVKNLLGLNAEIQGTGFMIKRSVLEAVGGFKNSLIEDFDLTLRLSLKGYKIRYAENTYVYDEKPTTWRTMIRQRSRWMAGYYELIGHYLLRPKILLKLLLKDPFKLLLLFSPTILISPLIILILPLFSLLTNITYYYLPLPIWLALLILYYLPPVTVLVKRGYTPRQAIKRIPMLAAFSLHWYVAAFKGLFVRSWASTKTEHGFIKPTEAIKITQR